jgi:hypothetical protein
VQTFIPDVPPTPTVLPLPTFASSIFVSLTGAALATAPIPYRAYAVACLRAIQEYNLRDRICTLHAESVDNLPLTGSDAVSLAPSFRATKDLGRVEPDVYQSEVTGGLSVIHSCLTSWGSLITYSERSLVPWLQKPDATTQRVVSRSNSDTSTGTEYWTGGCSSLFRSYAYPNLLAVETYPVPVYGENDSEYYSAPSELGE